MRPPEWLWSAMYIDPSWKVLTVGDGDLSFSKALHVGKRLGYLEASVYDAEDLLRNKYTQNELNSLRAAGVKVYTELDITNPDSFREVDKQFDVVIFQFPIISGSVSSVEFKKSSLEGCGNLLNRKLLRMFLINSVQYLLSEKGAQLCFITSKDVKPYNEWNLEVSLNYGIDIPFCGSMRFDSAGFLGYRIRNIARDMVIAETRATTYVWGQSPRGGLVDKLTLPRWLRSDCCAICRAGPFVAEEDRLKHYRSKGHTRNQTIEDRWIETISHDS